MVEENTLERTRKGEKVSERLMQGEIERYSDIYSNAESMTEYSGSENKRMFEEVFEKFKFGEVNHSAKRYVSF